MLDLEPINNKNPWYFIRAVYCQILTKQKHKENRGSTNIRITSINEICTIIPNNWIEIVETRQLSNYKNDWNICFSV